MTLVNDHKRALLYIMRELMLNTDEEHALNAAQLSAALKSYGCEADRRTIYANIEVLTDYGLDIIKKEGNRGGYYLGSRDFELPELKLLVDAVQSSRFITARKTKVLIDKLEKLASVYQAGELNREVFIRDNLKAVNEKIFYSVDSIYSAMNSNKKVSFQYAEWTPEKKLAPKKAGELYKVSPWALTWADENYYLIAFDDRDRKIKHYRVDKMLKMKVTEEDREGRDEFGEHDPAAFARKTFGMYGGRDRDVTIKFRNSLAGVMIDRFGSGIMVIPDGEEYSRTTITISVSPQFYGWITGIGKGIEIASPADVRDEYREYLKGILGNYE